MIHITINGKPVEAEEGTTIMAAAESVGIRIPSLCHMKNVHQGFCHGAFKAAFGHAQLISQVLKFTVRVPAAV